MSKIVGLNRRAFMKSAGMTALVGAAGTIATGASTASAQSSTEIPKLAGGKYDFDTPYNRVGTKCARWDGPALRSVSYTHLTLPTIA